MWTRTAGLVALDAYRFHIGLNRLKWPYWEDVLLEAAAVHDKLYETAQTAADYRRADRTFIEIAARNNAHPVQLLLAWFALRSWAAVRLTLS